MPKGFTQPDWLSAAAREAPDAPALVQGENIWTYAELSRRADEIAGGFAAAGIARGDRVGLLLPNSFEHVAFVWGAWRCGATVVALNLRLTPGEVADQVARSDCQYVVIDASLDATYAARMPAACCTLQLPDRETSVVGGIATGVLPSAPPASDSDQPPPEFTRQDIALVMFTSGTSGQPKGVQLTFNNLYYAAMASTLRLGNPPGDRWLLTLPLYHIGGLSMLVRTCLCRAPIIVLSRFDPAALLAAAQRHQATLISLVPTMLYRVLHAQNALEPPFPPSVRLVLLGGAAADPDLLAEAYRRGVPVATTYGLTEACSQVCTALPDEVRTKPGTVGRALPFMRVRIVGEGGRAQPPGEVGEIVVQGPNVMFGYLGDTPPDIPLTKWGTPERLPYQDGFPTGDLGYLDDDGDLFVLTRRSDLIVSGGENVYPAEVERVLREHPAIADVCVVGLPSAEWGQQVAAAVLRAQIGFAEIEAFARTRLGGYKVPRVWRFVAALPLNAAGKIDRAAVVGLFG